MKKLILFLLTLIICANANATLTPGTVPVTKTGGSSPALQNGSITDTGTSAGVGNVGIGSTNPTATLDVNGKISSNSTSEDEIYNVKKYGAKGDGISANDGVVASGSNAFSSAGASFTSAGVGKVITVTGAAAPTSATTKADGAITALASNLTSATGAFAAANIGDFISINGAGAAGATLYTRITAVGSATSITVATAASTTVSGATYSYGVKQDLTTTIATFVSSTAVTLTANAAFSVSAATYNYGTDDTAAIQSAINAVGTNKGGTVFFPSGIYIINGTFNNVTHENAQLAIPQIDCTQVSQQIKLKGPYFIQSNIGSKPNLSGAILYFTRNGTAGQNGIGAWSTGTSCFVTNEDNVLVQIEGLTFRTISNPTHSLIDLHLASQTTVYYSNFESTGGDVVLPARPTTSSSYALRGPTIGNHAFNYYRHLEMFGFYNNIQLNEHANLDESGLYDAINAIDLTDNSIAGHSVQPGSEDGHGVNIKFVNIENCVHVLNLANATVGVMVNADYLDIERSGSGWFAPSTDIVDTNLIGYGVLKYGGYNITALTMTAGAHLTLQNINYQLTSGQWSGDNRYTAVSFNNTTTAAAMTGLFAGATSAPDNNLYFNVPSTYSYHFRVNNVEKTVIDPSGNIGIGTAVFSNTLQIVGNAAIGALANVGIASPTNGLYVQGNVGIGSTAAGTKLDVNGTVRSTNNTVTSINGLTQCVHADTNGVLSGTGSDCGSAGGSGTVTSSNINTVARYNATGTAVQGSSILFDNSTNVGIGTLTPRNKLDVNGNMAIGAYAGFNSAPANGLIISGNVGIGTTIAQGALQVRTGVDQNGFFQGPQNLADGVAFSSINDANSANKSIELRGSTVQLSTNGNFPINLLTNNSGNLQNTIRMSVTGAGNVGIGTTAPVALLDVLGTVRSTNGTAGAAACWTATKILGHCSTVVDASGNCTCS